MQHFINHAIVDRICSEVLASPRRPYYVMGLLACAIAATISAPIAVTWLGLTLLVAEGRKLFDDIDAASAPALSVTAMSTTLAAAPALIWSSRAPSGSVLAVAALIALGAYLISTDRRQNRLGWALAPLAVVGVVMFADAVAEGHALAAIAVALCTGFVVAALTSAARAAEHARAQDAEWVRQLNMTYRAASSAAWELDFTARTLEGGERLAALLGRPVDYADVVERACFACAGDKALVQAAFNPDPGPTRRVAIEHDALRPDGSIARIRHQGFLRVAPGGTPLRLTCISEPGGGDDAPQADAALFSVQRVLEEQAHSLLVISNELNGAGRDEFGETREPAAYDLQQQIAVIERRSARLADAIDGLVKAHHEAHEASLAKSQFLASMSHELRTPLNAIIGYAEMLQEDAADKGDDVASQDLTRILAAARHLLSLIGEILDLSKIEAGRVDVTAADFDIDELIEDVVDTMRPLAEQNRNSIDIDFRTGDLTLNTDATKLRQCVLNLMSNACKFTRDGKIDILVERRVLHGVPQIFITVTDTGIGMSPDQLSRLFQPFVQADPSISKQYGGTGLGLTITRRLAQLLGGDVSVHSELGAGASFTLHVPADFNDAASALGVAAQVDPLQGPEGAPMVLVIEDEPDARELVARALTRAGFAVQGVGGGETGLALARAKSPALIVLDIFLPDRSGWRVLQNLKHDPKTSDIPVVVLSVNEDREHAIALGAAEHIVKPADRDMLAATAMRLARGRPDLAAAAMAPVRRAAR